MHLVTYFCGTGDAGYGFSNGYYSQTEDDTGSVIIKGYRYIQNDANISTVFVRGCEQPDVCNGVLFPDLSEFAKRFTNKLFIQNDNGIRLTTSQNNLEALRVGIEAGRSTIKNEHEAIESITLCGYSRGAVTCFEVAKQLNRIAPKIPVDIVADQPVSENCYQGPGTNARSIADCSHLKNLRNVSVILGAYTGANINMINDKETTNLIHRGFFSQILPKLPRLAKRDLIIIPRESHHQNRQNAPNGAKHMHLQVATYLEK